VGLGGRTREIVEEDESVSDPWRDGGTTAAENKATLAGGRCGRVLCRVGCAFSRGRRLWRDFLPRCLDAAGPGILVGLGGVKKGAVEEDGVSCSWMEDGGSTRVDNKARDLAGVVCGGVSYP